MTHVVAPIEANLSVLRQGIAAIAQVGPRLYAEGPPGGGAPIGAQFRHVLDHYRCFLAGLPVGRIDYDARERDPAVEIEPVRAVAAAEQLIQGLGALSAEQLERPLLVNAAMGSDPDDPVDWAPSTGRRELGFLLSHTVHHYSLIGLLARQAGIEIDQEFGVAPSTLAYRKRVLACAP